MADALTPRPSRPPRGPHPALAAADRVAEIIGAAEEAADELERDTEQRMRSRIAEGERAAQFRIDAAEEEAEELVQSAQQEADRLAREGRERDESARTTATGEALAILAAAQQEADQALGEATEAAQRLRADAERESRERLRSARQAADSVHSEGLQLVSNLRAMSESLRSNSERLLRDVQAVHSQMIARIEVVEATRQSVEASSSEEDVPDVPEFIPRR